MHDVAAVAATCLARDGHAGQTYKLAGPEALSAAGLAEALSDVLGRRVTAVRPSLDHTLQGMKDAGLPDWAIDSFPPLLAHNRTGVLATVTPAVRDITGRDPTTWSQFVLGRDGSSSDWQAVPLRRPGRSGALREPCKFAAAFSTDPTSLDHSLAGSADWYRQRASRGLAVPRLRPNAGESQLPNSGCRSYEKVAEWNEPATRSKHCFDVSPGA